MKQGLKIHIDYWKKSAQRDLDTARVLFENKRYDSCLFFCHLSLEKLLKGLVMTKTQKAAPYIHDLERLALITELLFSKEQIENLRTITDFNIAGRYKQHKFVFYKECTKKYTEEYFKISEKIFLWLKKQYLKK